MHRLLICVLVPTGLLLAGCTTTGYTLSGSWPYVAEKPVVDEDTEPERIVAIWSHDVLKLAGNKSTQGFTGRLFFYDKKNRPTEVEGRLAVFAFDDSKGKKADWKPRNKPDRKFVYTEDQLPGHLGINKIGPSYSIWIPWQELGDTQKTVSLIPVLTNAEGDRVVGPPTKHVLPGKNPREEQARVTADPAETPVVFPSADDLRRIIHESRNQQDVGIQPAGFQQESNSGAIGTGAAVDESGGSEFARRTLTLDMSRNMARRYVATPVKSNQAGTDNTSAILKRSQIPLLQDLSSPDNQLIKPPLPVIPSAGVPTEPAKESWHPTLKPSSMQSYGDGASWGYRQR